MNGNRIKQVMDIGLSSLGMTEREMNGLIEKAEGGKKVKKKLSVAMVLTIIIIAIAATAIAATLVWEKYVIDIKKKEQTQGTYSHWEINSKQDLIKSLLDMGYIQESEQTKLLFQESTQDAVRSKIADDLLLSLTKQTDVREINADIITYAIFGPENTWTPEQRVWWQQVTNLFRNTDCDLDTLVISQNGDLPEKQAIAIAKEAIIKAYGLSVDALDKARAVADMYVTKTRPDYRRWMVQFQLIKAGTENYVERAYAAVVDNQGTVIADPDVDMPHVDEMAATYRSIKETTSSTLADEYYTMAEKAGNANLQAWTLEAKAEFTKNMRDRVLSAFKENNLESLSKNGQPVMSMIAAAHYVYGLPDSNVITQEQALKNARIALQQKYGYSADEAQSYDRVAVFFDITNSENPLWRLVFLPQYRFGMYLYRIEIDAKTEKIISIEDYKSQTYDLNINELPAFLKMY